METQDTVSNEKQDKINEGKQSTETDDQDVSLPSAHTAEEYEKPETRGDRIGIYVGIFIWVLIFVAIWFFFIRPDRVKIYLDVPTEHSRGIEAKVMYKGRTTDVDGNLQLIVEDPKRNVFLGSGTIPIKDGIAEKYGFMLFGIDADDLRYRNMRINASFDGHFRRELDDDGVHLQGKTKVYVNTPRPFKEGSLWAIVGIGIFLVGLQIIIFTGQMTAGKLRALFVVMYCMTFFSMLAPPAVAVFLHASPYLVEMLEDAPVGIVKGQVDGDSKIQWFLNIGGGVKHVSNSMGESLASGPADTDESTREVAGTVAAQELGLDTRGVPRIEGGIVVPFYIIVLAMFGAGINMTRTVPKIQKEYHCDQVPVVSLARDTLEVILNPFMPGEVISKKYVGLAAKSREALIHNYMYLLSAPFLAIAVYYLLQMMATDITEPLLVVMAFATGLISDRIIISITKLAEKILGGEAEGGETEDAKRDNK